MNEQMMASGPSQGGNFLLARARSIAGREDDPFSRAICERRMERQRCTFSDDLYATLSTVYAVDASVRPRAPRSPSFPRRSPRQPCRRSLSHPVLAPSSCWWRQYRFSFRRRRGWRARRYAPRHRCSRSDSASLTRCHDARRCQRRHELGAYCQHVPQDRRRNIRSPCCMMCSREQTPG
jgi:hypothetical protein